MSTNPTLTRIEKANDPMGSYWHDRFMSAARKLLAIIGSDAYTAWFTAEFPNDTAQLHTWQVKAQATEQALKEAQEAAHAS